jgi:hypothetical protein
VQFAKTANQDVSSTWQLEGWSVVAVNARGLRRGRWWATLPITGRQIIS